MKSKPAPHPDVWIAATLRGGLYAAAATPLVVLGTLYFPFVSEKTLWFQGIVEALLGGWILLVLINREYLPTRSPLGWALLLFFMVVGCADLLGVDPYRSFFGDFARMDGFLLYLHLGAYALVLASVIRGGKAWRRYFAWCVVVAVIAALGAVLQVLALAPPTAGSTRPGSLLGSPTFLANYLVVALAVVAFLLPRASRSARAWYLAAASVISLGLILTGTRAALLGVLVGCAALALWYVFAHANAYVRLALAAALAAAILGAAAFIALRNEPWITHTPFLARYADALSVSEYSPLAARAFVWRAALAGAARRPLLGVGQSNFDYVFDRYASEEFHTVELWFDHSHNVFLDWLATGGVLGLLAYLGLFGAFLWMLARAPSDRYASFELAALATGVLAYAVADAFAFETLPQLALLFAVFAYIWNGDSVPPAPHGRVPSILVPTGIAAITLALLYVFTIRPAQALWYIAAGSGEGAATPQERLDDFSRALSLASDQFAVREALARVAFLSFAAPDLDPHAKQVMLAGAIAQMQRQTEQKPLRLRAFVLLGQLESAAGDHGSAQAAYERALAFAPRKQFVYFGLIDEYLAQKHYAAALEAARAAYLIEPKFEDAVKYYARAAIYAGDDSLAQSVLYARYGTSAISDPGIINAYADRKEYGEVARLWLAYAEAHPEDVQGRFSLAAAQYAAGDLETALATLTAIEQYDPATVAQVEALKRQLATGRSGG